MFKRRKHSQFIYTSFKNLISPILIKTLKDSDFLLLMIEHIGNECNTIKGVGKKYQTRHGLHPAYQECYAKKGRWWFKWDALTEKGEENKRDQGYIRKHDHKLHLITN